MLCRFASVAALMRVAACEVSFDEHLQRFGKSFTGEEYETRKALFEQAAADVELFNAMPGRTWTAGLTELSHMSPQEQAQQRGYNKAIRQVQSGHSSVGLAPMASVATPYARMDALASGTVPAELPASVDWRTAQPPVLTPVKAQGACGSCWAFAAAETIESHAAINTGLLLSLSPQQLNSCTPNPHMCGGSGGCQGATPQLAFNYTMQAGGLSSIWSAPYTSGSGLTPECQDYYSSQGGMATISGYETLPANDASALEEATRMGPVSVSVDATLWGMYEGGIFDACNKTSPDINHAVQLAGFGEENGTKYWLVRNSWGALWGEDGYIRLKRYDTEPCGMDASPQNGFGCAGDTSPIRACGECGILSDSSYPTGVGILGFGHPHRRLQEASQPIHM
jgi:cathepsin L